MPPWRWMARCVALYTVAGPRLWARRPETLRVIGPTLPRLSLESAPTILNELLNQCEFLIHVLPHSYLIRLSGRAL